MLSDKSLLAKSILVVSAMFLMMAMKFAIDQFRAESYWPVERNFTRSEIELSETDKAASIKKAISLSPQNADYHLQLAKHYVYESNDDSGQRTALLTEAVSEYKEALFLNPSFTDALSHLAWAEFSIEKPMDALHRLETATTYDPSNFFNHLYYGICVSRFLNLIPDYLKRIYIRKAENALEKGISLYPMMIYQPMVLSARADLYLKRGDIASAISVLERAQPPDSSTLPLHLRLASLYLRSDMTGKGIIKYSSLLRNGAIAKNSKKEIIKNLKADSTAHPEVLELKYLFGSALVEDEQWSSAIETLKELSTKKYRPAQTHFLLAQAYEGSGDRKSAYEEYVSTLNYQKNHQAASTKVIELFKESSK